MSLHSAQSPAAFERLERGRRSPDWPTKSHAAPQFDVGFGDNTEARRRYAIRGLSEASQGAWRTRFGVQEDRKANDDAAGQLQGAVELEQRDERCGDFNRRPRSAECHQEDRLGRIAGCSDAET